MRGSVKRRGNLWSVVLDVGTDPATGKRQQRRLSGYTTKREAQQALTDALKDAYDGTRHGPARATVRGYLLDTWLPGIATTLRATTLDGYRRMVTAHIVPRLGALELRGLTPAHLNAMYAALLDRGNRRTGESLSSRTVNLVHVTMHRALKDACRWGLLAGNVADDADPPRQAHTEIAFWRPEELGRFLRAIQGERWHTLYLLAATTGLRRGELVGLRWSQVDLDGASLAVTQTRVVAGGKVVTSEPKTSRSRRRVALDPATVAALRAWHRREAEERLQLGAGWRDTGLVFTWPTGEPVAPDVVSRTFDRLVKRHGLPRMTLHGLRHTWASTALVAGIPAKVVSERLGHSNIGITLDLYTHVVEGLDEQAASTVAALVLGGP